MMGRFAANSFKALTTNMSYMLTIYSVAGIGLGCLGAFLQLKGFGSIEVFQILVLLILPTHFLTYGTYRLFETQTPPRTNFLRSFSKSKPRTQWERVGQIAVTERLLEKSDLEVVLKTFREQAEKRYLYARNEAAKLEDVKAVQWPTLPLDRVRLAIGALRAYQGVDDFVKQEKSEKEPASHALLLQRLGVFAYYADNDYERAIGFLTEAIKLFPDVVDDAFKSPQAWAMHFLGVLKKNWPLRAEEAGTSLRQAQELFATAESYLTMESGQFLTPLTHAEVLSYLPDQHRAATFKLHKIVELLQGLYDRRMADNNQAALLPRAYLIIGNIAQMHQDWRRASYFFAKACDLAATNPYPWLSLAQASVDVDTAKRNWAKGLGLLSRPPALDRPEISTRVLIFSWGILASHFLGDTECLNAYRTAYDEIGSLIERELKYSPLFFSPITKNLVQFVELRQQLAQRLNTHAAGGA